MDDQQLHDEVQMLRAMARGEEAALSYFFQKHHHALCYFASRLIQDVQQAEDIVADCFLKLWERKEGFADAEKIKAFLYLTCRNSCFNYLRDLKRKTAIQESYFLQLSHHSEEVLYDIVETEVVDILGREIEALPEKCREVFKLLYFEEKKTDEVAALLNITVQTVRNHKTNAIALLKAKVLKNGLFVATMLAMLVSVE